MSGADRGPTRMLVVRVHPGASRERVAWDGRTLDVWVTARPVEGAANRAVEAALAAALGVRRSAVRLVAGGRSRDKLAEVEGVTGDALDRLAGSRPPPS